MASLLELAHEVLHNIFIQVNPSDLAAISATCKALQDYVTGNRLLFKELYLQILDDPAADSPDGDPDYISELKKVTKLQKLLESTDDETKQDHLPFITSTAISLLSAANADPAVSLNVALLNSHFKAGSNAEALLSCSSLFSRASGNTPRIPLSSRQLSAKLHSYYGISIDHFGRRCSSTTFPHARAVVYDIRGYTDSNGWGPFLDDEWDNELVVDWEKVEAIMVVLGYNMRHFSEHHGVDIVWDSPFGGTKGNRLASKRWQEEQAKLIRQPDLDVQQLDPYGVTGTWRRVVCFLDYNDFYLFNFNDPNDSLQRDIPRDAIYREEAIRLITMKLYATKIEAPGEHDNPALPVVHFRGSSHAMHPSWDPNANSAIRGTVRLTNEGEVRWTTLSIFHGEARWKSEGIQVGGIRSDRGVIGTWFDKDYNDQEGPCGPTAFWKLSDVIDEDKPPRPTSANHVLLQSLINMAEG